MKKRLLILSSLVVLFFGLIGGVALATVLSSQSTLTTVSLSSYVSVESEALLGSQDMGIYWNEVSCSGSDLAVNAGMMFNGVSYTPPSITLTRISSTSFRVDSNIGFSWDQIVTTFVVCSSLSI